MEVHRGVQVGQGVEDDGLGVPQAIDLRAECPRQHRGLVGVSQDHFLVDIAALHNHGHRVPPSESFLIILDSHKFTLGNFLVNTFILA